MQATVQRALVVDDSRLARIALSKLLQKRNVTVAAVETGSAALDYLRDDRPDVVFMDYMMPDMDGFEAIRRIRERYAAAELPVVMYTSQDSDEDRERAHELGISAFLIKPSGEDNLDMVLTDLSRQLAERPGTGSAPAAPEPEPAPQPLSSAEPAWQPAAEPVSEPAPEPVAEPVSEPVPEPGAATPAIAEVPWVEIRAEARQAASETAAQTAADAARAELEPLRRQLAEAAEQASASARDEAREVAERAAREAAEAIADSAARAIAGKVAEDASARMVQEIGPEAARRILSELREDIRGYMGELLSSDTFREQLSGVVADTALPRLKDAIKCETLPPLRDELVIRTGEEATSTARSVAIRAASDTVEQLSRQFRKENETHIRELADEQTSGLRRGLWAVAIAGLVLVGLALGLAGAALLT